MRLKRAAVSRHNASPTVRGDNLMRRDRLGVARRDWGLDPAAFAAHSLRCGFLTSAAESGASIWKLSVSRHRSLDTLRGYVRRVDLFKEHVGAAFL
jgi:hypothetical protein